MLLSFKEKQKFLNEKRSYRENVLSVYRIYNKWESMIIIYLNESTSYKNYNHNNNIKKNNNNNCNNNKKATIAGF